MLNMNKEILDKLLLREEDNHPDIPANHSVNGYMFAKSMNHWNKEDQFPIQDFKRYVRMHEWIAGDFNPRVELILLKQFPRWLYLVYLAMKEFKSSSRYELLAAQDAFGRMMGYPLETPNERAYCVYEYAIQMYYEGEQNVN